jgi:hypothetical protein
LTRSLHSSRPPGCLWQSPSFSCGESMVFMDIQSDGEYLLHWCVSLLCLCVLNDTTRHAAPLKTDPCMRLCPPQGRKPAIQNRGNPPPLSHLTPPTPTGLSSHKVSATK